jgi:hypothetical protein
MVIVIGGSPASPCLTQVPTGESSAAEGAPAPPTHTSAAKNTANFTDVPMIKNLGPAPRAVKRWSPTNDGQHTAAPYTAGAVVYTRCKHIHRAGT